MPGRADARSRAAHDAARRRMRDAAARLRDGSEVGDEAGLREGVARLLERVAERDADVYVHGDAANIASRVLAPPPGTGIEGGPSVASGWRTNGQNSPGSSALR